MVKNMQISKKNERLIVQISVILAIPIIILALVFFLAVGIHQDKADYYYNGGRVALAQYYSNRADEAFLYSIICAGFAFIFLSTAVFLKRRY